MATLANSCLISFNIFMLHINLTETYKHTIIKYRIRTKALSFKSLSHDEFKYLVNKIGRSYLTAMSIRIIE